MLIANTAHSPFYRKSKSKVLKGIFRNATPQKIIHGDYHEMPKKACE